MSEIIDFSTPAGDSSPGVFHSLRCHPANAAPMIGAVEAGIAQINNGALRFLFRLRGDISRLRIPAETVVERGDLLWQHTCCEAFVGREGDPVYREFNFSPSGRWAVYDFADYRQRLADPSTPPPRIETRITEGRFELIAELSAAALPMLSARDHVEIGLTMIVEAKDTVDEALSYWALRHEAPRPDFHRREGFALRWTNS